MGNGNKQTGPADFEPETGLSGTANPLDAGPSNNEGDVPWPSDELAEAAFRSDAHDRGETVLPAVPAVTETEEVIDPKALPPLEELVKRIPPEVLETLDDLFRAKFTAVKRVPPKALKK